MNTYQITLSERDDIINVIRALVPTSWLVSDECDNNYYHNNDESETLIIMSFSAVYTNMNEGIHVVFTWHNFTNQIHYFMDKIDEVQTEYSEFHQTADKLITERDENIEFMRECIDNQIDIITQLRDDNHQKDVIIDELKKESDYKNEVIEGQDSTIMQLDDMINERNQYIDELNNKIARLELTNEELNNKIRELNHTIDLLLSNNRQYEQTVQVYRDRIETSENGKKQFTERAKKVIAEKNEKIDYLNDFICSLQKHLYTDRQTIKEYEEKIKILQNENDVLWNVIFD